MLKLHMLIFGVSALTACGQTVHQTAVKGLVIDPGISKEAKAHIAAIADMDSLYQGMPMSVYSNAVWVKAYEADTLTFADTSFSNKQLFKSFYVWNDDTLVINGSFGLFGGIGFSIHVSKEGATLYHLVNADAYKTLGYRPNDTLTDILNVPCTQAKMVLSELPDSNQKQTIFGYAALESATYYHGTMADGKEQLPRSKQRMDMRIYFKSSFLKL